MSFRKWMVTFLIALLTSAVLLGLFNYVADPFGVFGDRVLKWHSYNMVNNPRVAKIGYLDQYHDRYDSYIIGGSKSSSLAPALLNNYYGDAKFYSMLMYGGDFYDYEKTLYYLVDHYKVKNIIVHLSMQEISHYNTASEDLKKRLHAKVSGEPLLPFYLKYLTLTPKYGYTKLEGYAKRAVDPFQFAQFKPEDGVYNKVKRDAEKVDDLEMFWRNNPSFNLPMGELKATAIDQNVASIARMKTYCEERNINFKLVTGATYKGELASYNLEDLKTYWRKIAEVTDFWDFSGYTPVSGDPRFYYDSMHYRNSVGEMMTGFMFNDPNVYVPAGFGHYTTKDNASEHAEKVFTKPVSVSGGATGEKKVPILMYHHLSPDFTDAMTISPDKLRKDLLALKVAGYETIFLQDLVDYVYNRKELPEKPIAITFDDGYSSNYEYAFPLLKELGMKATLSVIGWSVGQSKYKNTDKDIYPHFTWKQAKEMFESGLVDIQNHSYDMHEPGEPNRKGVLQLEGEPSGSYSRALKEDTQKLEGMIEENVGNDVFVYTYPYGAYTLLSEQILSDLDYKVTLTTKKGVNVLQKGNPQSLFALKRINAGLDKSGQALVDQIEGK